jgi:hypothetical protein
MTLELLDAIGATLEEMGGSGDAETISFPVVPEGPELMRILALAKRPPPAPSNPELVDLGAFLTQRLATTQMPYPGGLRPMQAAALHEAWQCRGLAGFLRVGAGKTLTAGLLPTVLGARNPLYIAPASLREDVMGNPRKGDIGEFARLRQHWQIPQLPFLSYEMLSAPTGGEELGDDGSISRQSILERARPDMLLLDEAHGAHAAVALKRIRAYLRKYPGTPVIVLTGTPFKDSIYGPAVLLEMALGDKSPLPRPAVGYTELRAWASYLDVAPSNTEVGALLHFLNAAERAEYDATPGYEDKRNIVRTAVSRRIYNTAGVISSQEGRLVDDSGREIGLEMLSLIAEPQNDAIDEFFGCIKKKQLPDGTILEDKFAVGRHQETAGYGYWGRFSDPQPPKWFLDARREWQKWCRDAIASNRRGIDSVARMERAVRRRLYNDKGKLAAWDAAQKRYTAETGLEEPPSEVVWLADDAVIAAGDWAREHGGLIWVRGVELGERIAERVGCPYYGAKGTDAKTKQFIMKHQGGPAVCSVQSNRRGRNLQKFWSKQLFMTVPDEQALGRLHRPGQEAAAVQSWLYIGCRQHLASLLKAKDSKAVFQQIFTQTEQKLVYAEGELPSLEALAELGGPRWTK